MIDIFKQKHLFPLRNFDDIERLVAFNLDNDNGEPNLALLSIVFGVIEHSLVTVSDKEDLVANSRPVQHRKDIAQRLLQHHTTNKYANPTQGSHNLSSTSGYQQSHHQHINRISQLATDSESDYSSSDLSTSASSSSCSSPDYTSSDNLSVPEIEFELVETLYERFVDQIKNSIDFKDAEFSKTNLKIKKISDCVWEHLSNSYYKDKAHLQSIFSYLTTSKLDCFGLAFAVIAGCQILNIKNIYLALSEDHAWVMFDQRPEEIPSSKEREIREYIENNMPIPTCAQHGTCEVTWHGKANSDKRGQPVTYKNCWLYTNGYAVKCDVRLCVAALVSSINPSINTNTDSEILALLQQRILWLLFNLKNYFPMSLGNLGELENLCPTPNAPMTPHELFNLGIEISRNQYNDSHVYPYSYLASFFFNHGRFKEALETWADASSVMTKYNYSRDDEEIYKEFFEIANELIPSMLKVLTAGGLEPAKVSTKPFLQDPDCLALILKFYDNICCWEEGSSTPVLHIGWAKNFVATALKFSYVIRSKIKLLTEEEWSHNHTCSNSKSEDVPRSPPVSTHREAKNGSSTSEKFATSVKASIKEEGKRSRSPDSSVADETDSTSESYSKRIKLMQRENRLEFDSDNNVTVILRSRKITGVRDLLQAERLNKTAVELQLTAQSQCAVRGRSNSSSYSSDFISTALTSTGGTTRSKRLQR